MADDKKYRDSITGEYVTEEYAQAYPHRTVRESDDHVKELKHLLKEARQVAGVEKARADKKKTPHELVMEFHKKYGLHIGHKPGFDSLTKDLEMLRLSLISEELEELGFALLDRDLVEVADALGDLVYVIYGFAIVLGINLDDVLEEIQRSNLSKLDDDGKPIYREDGKVLKGPNFSPPNIQEVLDKQTPLTS
jgi:NTP pyrophosphatase (non-canonical NTP hydrolase)